MQGGMQRPYAGRKQQLSPGAALQHVQQFPNNSASQIMFCRRHVSLPAALAASATPFIAPPHSSVKRDLRCRASLDEPELQDLLMQMKEVVSAPRIPACAPTC